MAANKKMPGGRLNRSEVVSVRLDPRTYFGAELAAVRQRRTLSSLIECAIDAYLAQVNAGPDGLTVEKVVHEVWTSDPVDRLVELAFNYPHLLSHDQQVLWDTACSYGPLWKGYWSGNFWTYTCQEFSLIDARLKELWPRLEAVAMGELSASELPRFRVGEFIISRLSLLPSRRSVRERSFEVTWLTPEELAQLQASAREEDEADDNDDDRDMDEDDTF